MEDEKKNSIYDRLLVIDFKIDTEPVLDPRYLNEKIGELHGYIQEVEKFAIQISKEISVFQRALNNAEAKYEDGKERLLTEDPEIKNFPNIKDREAKANSKLKEDLQNIRAQKNEVFDLNNLLKAINLKLKNLSRANMDIRMQLRIMESQIKLGQTPVDSVQTQNVLEEAKKNLQKVDSEAKQQNTVDPSKSLTEDLFGEDDRTSDEEIQEEQESEEVTEDLIEPFHQPTGAENEIVKEAEKSMSSENAIDLDKVLNEETQPKSEPALEETQSKPQPEPETGGDVSAQTKENSQREESKSTDKIDIDELLAQY